MKLVLLQCCNFSCPSRRDHISRLTHGASSNGTPVQSWSRIYPDSLSGFSDWASCWCMWCYHLRNYNPSTKLSRKTWLGRTYIVQNLNPSMNNVGNFNTKILNKILYLYIKVYVQIFTKGPDVSKHPALYSNSNNSQTTSLSEYLKKKQSSCILQYCSQAKALAALRDIIGSSGSQFSRVTSLHSSPERHLWNAMNQNFTRKRGNMI